MTWHDQRGVCPVLIGRAGTVQDLQSIAAKVRDGLGQTVVVTGEAGVGKSRLVAELRDRLTDDGFLCLEGQCFELDRSLPYAPILDLLRSRFARLTTEALVQEVGAAAPDLAQLLPELAVLLPDATSGSPLDPEQAKRRLFHAFAQMLAKLSEQQPVVMIAEDLHWSDEASLELLLYLARSLVNYPILLLLTYRSDEPSDHLTSTLAELDRGRLTTEVGLTRLTAVELDGMVQAIFGLDHPVSAEFVHALHDLTDGNPFFVEEVLRSLLAEDAIVHAAGGWERRALAELRIPRTVADAVRRRANLLSEPAREVLRLAAVIGRRFDFGLLQELTGHDETQLLHIIRELITTHLVVEISAEAFAFRHALTREAVYTQLLARERVILHRLIARTLERLDLDAAPVYVEDLAYHCFEAGLWEQALKYAQRAGERAQALYAPRAAVDHFTRALAAVTALGSLPAASLHRARGQSHDVLGDFEAARTDYTAALDLASANGDRQGAWQALHDLGLLWTGRDYRPAYDYLRRALDLARAIDDPALEAHSLNRLGNWYSNNEDPTAAESHHQAARAIFEQLDDRSGLASTLDLLGMARLLGGDLIRGAQSSRQAADIFRQLNDRQGLVGALIGSLTPGGVYEVDTLVGAGSLAEATSSIEPMLALTRDIGWRSGEAYTLAVLAEAYGCAGDFGRGLELMRRSLAIAEEIGHRQWIIQASWGLSGLHADVLALPEAVDYRERALALTADINSANWMNMISGGLASSLVALGSLDQAAALLDTALSPAMPMQTQGQRQLWCARVELLLARAEPAPALSLLDRLYASAANLTAEGDIPRLARLKAHALMALGRPEPARALLTAATATAKRIGSRPILWRLHASLAELHRDQGQPAAAASATAGRALVDQLATSITEHSLRDGFLRQATQILTGETAAPGHRRAAATIGGLTEREREVASRIAHGRTNREIADALFISERTVESHTSNILRRLGFSSRSQIAAWVVEHGLTRDAT